jgi:hypothetical protein
MSESSVWFRFILAALAVWRLTHLLAAEDGPWDLILRLRRRLDRSFWGKLMDCFYCLSLWVAAPLAFAIADRLGDRIFAWLALSGAACLANRIGREPVVFERLSSVENQGERTWDAVVNKERN